MSQETYLVALPPEERRHFLERNASRIEEGKYVKPLTEEEVMAAKDQLTDNCIKLGDLTEALAEIKKEYKDKIDPVNQQIKMIIGEIRSRQSIKEGNTYHIANYPENVMETYNEAGEYLGNRRLKPDEKQGLVFQLNQAK